MVFILDSGVGFHMRIWAASTGSLLMDNTSTRLTMNWAETVAAAAPATPSPGIGPRPKIRMGSRIILAPIPMQFAIKGVLLLPEAVYRPVRVCPINANTMNPQAILRYVMASATTCGELRWKKPISGSASRFVSSPYAAASTRASCSAPFPYCMTSLRFPSP